MGYGFSFETWNQKHEMVGGLYGVAMGKAFFGESMFSRETDASKVAWHGWLHGFELAGLNCLIASS